MPRRGDGGLEWLALPLPLPEVPPFHPSGSRVRGLRLALDPRQCHTWPYSCLPRPIHLLVQTLSSFFGSLPGFSSARNLLANAHSSVREARPSADTTGAKSQASGEWPVPGGGTWGNPTFCVRHLTAHGGAWCTRYPTLGGETGRSIDKSLLCVPAWTRWVAAAQPTQEGSWQSWQGLVVRSTCCGLCGSPP